MSVKVLPTDITSYDLFKTLAVITMIIDHIGIYFFPDDVWWRTIGRMSFPIWLFLVGYARNREIPNILIAGAVILFASNFVAGMGVFPLSILVAIAVVRLTLNPLMNVFSRSPTHLWVGSISLFIIALPSFILFEFGALAFTHAIFGYLVRHLKDEADRRTAYQYAVFVCVGYVLLQSLGYGLDGAQMGVLAVGMTAITYGLYHFKPQTYPQLSQRATLLGRGFLQFCGRRTLEIYVGHLLLFKALAVYLGVEGFVLFNWEWVW